MHKALKIDRSDNSFLLNRITGVHFAIKFSNLFSVEMHECVILL